VEFFRNIHCSQIAFRLSSSFWLQRCWLSHLPKKLDWPSLLATLARFAHHHPVARKNLRCGFRTHEDNTHDNWNERLETLLSDFQRWDHLRSEDERSLLGGLSEEMPNTLVYAGHSPAFTSDCYIDHMELELLTQLMPGLVDRQKLHQQTIEMRNHWQVADLVFQDRSGHFYSFRPEKQTLRGIRKDKRQDESVHFGAFSLTLDKLAIGADGVEMEYGSFQFAPVAALDMDLMSVVVELLQSIWQRLAFASPDHVPYLMVEGNDSISNRLLMTKAVENGLTRFDRLSAPGLVFGSHPLVSFAEFIAWSVGPRIFTCLKPQQGILSYAVIHQDLS